MKPDKHIEKAPPAWAVRFFRWYCNDHLAEAVLGDLLELHERRIATSGKRTADILFLWNVLIFLQPFALKRKSQSTSLNTFAMFENYFKIAWRTMLRQKMYTSITIGGFALGLATCIVIFLFIRHEVSFDKYYKEGDRVFRIYNDYTGPDGGKWTSTPASVASLVKSDYPEVEKSGRLVPQKWFNAGSNLFRREDQVENTYEEGFAYADNDLLDILEIKMVYGNRSTALAKPNTIVLSKRMADKYFPHQDPTGKLVILNESKNKVFAIGGVMEDFPVNSHLHYEFLITLAGVEFWPGEQTSWCCWNYDTYVKIRKDANAAVLEKKLVTLRDNYLVTFMVQTGDQSVSDVKKYQFFRLQPVSDIYLKSQGIGDELKHGDTRYVWLFGGIAVFILLLACINFINLSTAKSANRAKEVGLRKTIGSVRGYLIRQFLTESLVYSFASFAIALFFVALALPFFNSLSGRELTMPWMTPWFVPAMIAAAALIGIVAGIYPAFYLSGFKPAEVLKGSLSRGTKGSGLRSAMVVFQFTTSIILIIGTMIIYQQMNYILHTKVGFEKDQVITIQGVNTLEKQQASFKNELMQIADVDHVTINNYLPVAGSHRDQNGFWKEGKSKEERAVSAQRWVADEDYLATMSMKLVEGRNFDQKLASDSQAIIINQAMAKAMGFKKPIGERITNGYTFTVIGVVENFHYESMKGEIRPLAITYGTQGEIASVKIKSKDMANAIQQLTNVWNKFMPNQPFRYSFLSDSYARMYQDVTQMGRIFAGFASLAIIVACLGLFALSAFMVEQRSKEVSIRLVMGASGATIFRLLTQNFVQLVLLSFLLAAPLAWYMMHKWLEEYAYRITMSWQIFASAGLLSILIAVVTVSYQSIRATLVNPATRLRSE